MEFLKMKFASFPRLNYRKLAISKPRPRQKPTLAQWSGYFLRTTTYVRPPDAEADQADWREVARIVLGIDPTLEPDRAALSTVIWLAPSGRRVTAIGISCAAVGRKVKIEGHLDRT
ncbi:hypothetical protein [Bradyrhizobium macuxiense]|uniref:hypothetical protein n=1 Tax=Bradyrhizobium macuxiense TaxID=1755647 RepID=UPI003D9BF484